MSKNVFAALPAAIVLSACSGMGSGSQALPAGNQPSSTAPAPLKAAASTAAAGYTIRDLGALPGDSSSETGNSTQSHGFGLNDLGQVVGASTGPTTIATLFKGGGTTNLNTLGASISFGNAINSGGEIAGQFANLNDSCACQHAFLYNNGAMHQIDSSAVFPGGAIAYAINTSGEVVGQGFINNWSFHAFLYANGKMTDLNPDDGYQSIARSINDSGQIIGSSTGDGGAHPGASTWLYSNGTIVNLSTSNSGFYIDNEGRIVGENSSGHGVLYSNGAWTDLGGVSGAATVALGINRSGQVVGEATFPVKSYHPFVPGKTIGVLFTSSGPVDLDTLIPANSGFTITEATAINASGQIAADAKNSSGKLRAVLLTPQ